MQDPSSYTFKLTNRAGTNIYAPYGDGPPSSGWQALPDSHNTMATNASLQISWKGTAITVNGFVNSSQGLPAYMLSLDGQQLAQETLDDGRTNAEILLSKTGLPLAYHTLFMSNIEGGNMTVKGIQLSISTGANRTTWKESSVAATLTSNGLWSPNPFFTFGGNWFPGKTSFAPPMLTTPAVDNTSSTLSFTLSQCSAFFLYGPMTQDAGAAYNVKINPPIRDTPNPTLNNTLGPSVKDTFSPSTNDEILFWESAMDRNINYTVNVNILPGAGQWGISKLVTFDATDLATQPDSQSANASSGKMSSGLIVAIVVGILLLCCVGGASSKKVRSEVWVLKRVS